MELNKYKYSDLIITDHTFLVPLDYENEDDECFEDVSGGESNGDETRIWKIKVQGVDYFGNW